MFMLNSRMFRLSDVQHFIPDCRVTRARARACVCMCMCGGSGGRVMGLYNGKYTTLSDKDKNGALQVQNLA